MSKSKLKFPKPKKWRNVDCGEMSELNGKLHSEKRMFITDDSVNVNKKTSDELTKIMWRHVTTATNKLSLV